MQNEKNDTSGRELSLTRLLNAPIELVWEVWTDPKHIALWWGPDGFTNTISKMDVKPGGQWELVMHGPDGTDYKNSIIFTEVVLHKKLVFQYTSSPKHLTTVLFEKQGDKTLLNWHMTFESREQFIELVKAFKVDQGMEQNVARLSQYLAVLLIK